MKSLQAIKGLTACKSQNHWNTLNGLVLLFCLTVFCGCKQKMVEEIIPLQLFAWVSEENIFLYTPDNDSLRFVTRGSDPSLSFDGGFLPVHTNRIKFAA